jgi:hypothetical protein
MSHWWWVGIIAGAVVTLIAATLILVITSRANKVAGEIDELNPALAGVGKKTQALQQLSGTNYYILQITTGLSSIRRGHS